MFKKNLILGISLLIANCSLFSQISSSELNGMFVNTLKYAVPFLTIDPESRAGAMGDAGVATSPDVNSQHWNVAKYAFVQNDAGIGVSYVPWLRNLVGDINLEYLSGYYHFGRDQVVSASLRYFSLGSINFTDQNNQYITTQNPNEFALDFGYSRKFSDFISGGLAFRYINSDLFHGVINDVNTQVGQSFAADLGVYYVKPVAWTDKKGKLSFGVDISNIGAKMTYSSDETKDFLPTNLRIGGALALDLDESNSMTFTIDANKLLIPSQPYYTKVGNDSVMVGMNPNVSVLTGMIQSFYDSPGIYTSNGKRSVLLGELDEISYSFGLEYWYVKQFAMRCGYYTESEYNGNRQFLTAGVGFKMNVIGFDFSYLVSSNNNPLANTIRFSIYLNFDAFHKVKSS